MTERVPPRDRNRAQWVAFGVAAAVLALVVAAVVREAMGPQAAAQPVAEVVEVRADDGRWYVGVAVTNEGDLAGAQVQVAAELVVPGELPETGDQTVDFLGGGETRRLVFVFEANPADGDLSVAVAGFADPR